MLAYFSAWDASALTRAAGLASAPPPPQQQATTKTEIRAIAERRGVIGVVLDAWMLHPEWNKAGETHPAVTLDAVADQIHHVCQVTGVTDHVGVGSDLDGGYGTEQCPLDLDTIYDLQKIPELMRKRGYGQADAEAFMHGNWMRFFHDAWGA